MIKEGLTGPQLAPACSGGLRSAVLPIWLVLVRTMQVVLQYVDCESGLRVQRVVTRSIKLTGSKAEFIASVNAQAAAVLVSGRTVKGGEPRAWSMCKGL